ncbi:MAG: PHP domain-containing protein [Peptococcaceae bacterium]|jgi:predicted metal-dependent phosphoesterase TrpH|nr:PHP domain-containing protein [Peptococcaceae bacterium]MDH7525675.1 PHP domain-containing protein [Peptococcaceae bacterium]
MRADLHIHTTASDGSWTPGMLVGALKKKGISMFSVTDHDSVSNLSETQELAREEGLCFIPGVEISTSVQGNLFHILGYGIDPANRRLNELLQHNTDLMNKKDDDSIRTLIKQGYRLDFEKYRNYRDDGTRGGWKALNFLIDEGLCKDAGDFFTNLFTEKYRLEFPVFPPPEEVIKTVTEAGGVPFLAHPAGNLHKRLNLPEVLEHFTQLGITGIECWHPEHDREEVNFCLDWCRKGRLDISGGSDCHGVFIKTRQLGNPQVFLEQLKLDRLKSYLGI